MWSAGCIRVGPVRSWSRSEGHHLRCSATIRAARPVLEHPGVLVIGSEVPNLLEAGAAATLIVSQDLDVGVPISRHAPVKRLLPRLSSDFQPSRDEPSVRTPRSPELPEVNFNGLFHSH